MAAEIDHRVVMTQQLPGIGKTRVERMQRTGQLPAFLEQRKLRVALLAALAEYVAKARAEISCLHCGAEQVNVMGVPQYGVIWHHPDGDGDRGGVSDLVWDLATVEEIDAEIARCVPLCWPCHNNEHARMRAAAKAATSPECI